MCAGIVTELCLGTPRATPPATEAPGSAPSWLCAPGLLGFSAGRIDGLVRLATAARERARARRRARVRRLWQSWLSSHTFIFEVLRTYHWDGAKRGREPLGSGDTLPIWPVPVELVA